MGQAEKNPFVSAAPSMTKIVVASFVGTTIEWYDFFLYGTAAALLFNRLFFPELEPLTGTMAALATFTVGFLARPVGGVLFGHWGDRHGRKATLVASLMLMGIATFLIGTLPTYKQIGVAAPALLVLLRFVQGIGVGGEWGGAVLMTVEHGHSRLRGFYASWVQVGVPMGMVLANGAFALFALLPQEQFERWGWRVPFLAGALLMAVGLYIRLNVLESPVFKRATAARPPERVPMLAVLRTQWREVLLAIGARFAENTSFYIYAIFTLAYGTEQLQLSRGRLLACLLVASASQFITMPLFGRLSDELGRRPVYLFGAVATGVLAFPFFALLNTAHYGGVLVALLLAMGIAHAAMYGPQAAFFSELFRTRVRYSGASLGYQLASVVAGGVSPLAATALLKTFDATWPVATYLIVCATITCASVWLARETRHASLDG